MLRPPIGIIPGDRITPGPGGGADGVPAEVHHIFPPIPVPSGIVPPPSGINSVGVLPDTTPVNLTGPDAITLVYGQTLVQVRVIAASNDGYYMRGFFGICASPIESIVSLRTAVDPGWPAYGVLPASGTVENIAGQAWYEVKTSGSCSDLLKNWYYEGASGAIWQTFAGLVYLAYVQPKFIGSNHALMDPAPDFPSPLMAVVKGRKVYDPRSPGSPVAWSRNVALCIRDFLIDTTYGCGVASADLDDASFSAAADACDQVVSGAPRYTLDIAISDQGNAEDWLAKLLLHCGGRLVVQESGLLGLVVDAATSQTPVLLDGTNSRDPKVWPSSYRDAPSRVIVEYPREDLGWAKSQEIAETPALVAGTDTLREQVFQLEGCVRQAQAMRLARWMLRNQAWADGRAEVFVSPPLARLAVGDRVNLTGAGLTAAPFRIALKERQDSGEVRLELWEYDAAVYSDDAYAYDTPLALPSPPGDLVGWETGTNVTLVETTALPLGGKYVRTRIWTSKKFDLPSDQYALQLRIRHGAWAGGSPPTWASLDPATEETLHFHGNLPAESGRAYRLYVPSGGGSDSFVSSTGGLQGGGSTGGGTYGYIVIVRVEDVFGQLSPGVYFGQDYDTVTANTVSPNSLTDGHLTKWDDTKKALLDAGSDAAVIQDLLSEITDRGSVGQVLIDDPGGDEFKWGPVPAHSHVEGDVASLTTDLAAKAPTSRTISAGTGLTGGGDLSANRTLSADFGAASGRVCQGNDSRLSDARTPTAHATSHKHGGSDELATATPAANAIPKADSSGKLDTWVTGIPSGVLLMWPNATAPTGWLLCDGAAVSRSTYAALFAVTGTTYGAGNGTTTFNVPDLRQRLPLGKAASGTGNALGATGGAIDHYHEPTNATGATGAASASYGAPGALTPDFAATAGHVHDVYYDNTKTANPPFLVVNFIVKT